jgi:hypothetical protein
MRQSHIDKGRLLPDTSSRSQGEVQFLTGGNSIVRSPRAPFDGKRVSRSGAIPEPTVTVRMEENTTEQVTGIFPICQLCALSGRAP